MSDFFGEFAAIDDTDETVTEKALDGLLGLRKAEMREVLRPLVSNWLRNLRRSETRSTEETAFRERSGRPEADPTAERRAIVADLSSLLDLPFKIRRGRRVTFGDATVEEHQAYLEMLYKQQAGTARTVGLHEQAIEEITAAKVTCLRDVYKKRSKS